MLEQVLLTVVHESPEAAVGLFVASEPAQGHTLIEDLVGLGIVVVHSRSRFLRTHGGLLPTVACLFRVALHLIGQAKEVVEVVLLRPIEFALTKMMGVFQTFFE